MDRYGKLFFEIFSAAVRNEKIQVSDDDLQGIYKYAYEQGAVALIYNAVISEQTETLAKMKTTSKLNISRQILMYHELSVFLSLLNENSIIACVVKGPVLAEVYPVPELRVSGDIDLMVSREDIPEIKEILEKIDAEIDEKSSKSDYLSVFLGKILHLEIHVNLLEKDKGGFFSGFDQEKLMPFSKAKKINACNIEFFMPDITGHMIYLICHAAQHITLTGIGVRQIADCSLFAEYYKNEIDWGLFNSQMKELSLEVFSQTIFYIGSVSFGCSDNLVYFPKRVLSQKAGLMLEDCIQGGVFGKSSQERITASGLLEERMEEGKKTKLMLFFPPVKRLRERYKYAEKYAVLVPVAWFNRILDYWKRADENPIRKFSRSVEIAEYRGTILSSLGLFHKEKPIRHEMVKSIAPLICDILNEGMEVRLPISGVSMEPFLKSGRDFVILKKPERKLRRGDVVLFCRDNGTYILHRIWHISKKGYYICGDSTGIMEKADREQISAIAVSVERNGKKYNMTNILCKYFSLKARFFFPFRERKYLKSLKKEVR